MTVRLPVSDDRHAAMKNQNPAIEFSTPLRHIREPALLLDADGHVVSGNEAGIAFLGGGQRLLCVGRKLRGPNGETATILRAVADIAGMTDAMIPFRTVALASGSDEAPLVILFVRWWDPVRRTESKAAKVLAILQSNVPQTMSNADQFGFTSTESALAADLMVGLRLKDVALRRGRRITTIRTQLVGLMRKTGTTRQAELVSLLLRSHAAGAEAASGHWTKTTAPHPLSARHLKPRSPSFIHFNDNRPGSVRIRNDNMI